MAAHPDPATPPCPVPPALAWLVVVGSLGLAAGLIPSQRQLVGRLLEDGENTRAMAVARSQQGNPEQLAPMAPLSPLDRLREALTADYRGPGAVATLAIGSAADPVACLDLVHGMEGNLRPDQKRPLYVAIARSAFAGNNPALAAAVAEDAIRHGIADAVIRLTAVKAWRWAGRPEQALKVFEEWRKLDPASLTPAAVDSEISLCRELGANDRALGLLLSRLRGAAAWGAGELDLALTIAANAGRTAEVLPLLSAWVAAQPAGSASWGDPAMGKVRADPAFQRFAGILARHSEWAGQPGPALDWYLKLALLGDSFALGRAAELQQGLNRSSDWMRLLQSLVPLPGQPEYTRQLAKLLAEAGLYEEAPAIYGLWLRDHPQDITALAELGAMYSEMPEPEQALAIYEKIAAIDPGNLGARKEMADLRLVLKDFAGAFEIYNSLPDSAHDANTLENFGLLAESLGNYPAYHRALLIRYHRLHEPCSNDFLELARSFELINEPDGAIRILTEGLRHLPRSSMVRIQLAQAWRNQGNYDEAIRLLAVPALKPDLQAMSLFIEVCCLKEDYQQAFAFLGRGIERKFGFPPDVRLDLGHIYFNNGYMTEADALYSSVPDEPSLWPLIANARFRRGDLAGAETYQRRHLAAGRVPDAPGWLLMGDILRAGGREAEARDAYRKSLLLMEQKLENRPGAAAAGAVKPPTRPTTAFNP